MYIFSTPAPFLKAFALTGRDCSNTRYPGCRYACPGLWAALGFQPALAKSETECCLADNDDFVNFQPALAKSEIKMSIPNHMPAR